MVKYDPNLDPEVEKIDRDVVKLTDKTLTGGIWDAWIQLIVTAIILGVVIWVLHVYEAPADLMISVTIAASTLCLVLVFRVGFIQLHTTLVILIACVEVIEKHVLREFLAEWRSSRN